MLAAFNMQNIISRLETDNLLLLAYWLAFIVHFILQAGEALGATLLGDLKGGTQSGLSKSDEMRQEAFEVKQPGKDVLLLAYRYFDRTGGVLTLEFFKASMLTS